MRYKFLFIKKYKQPFFVFAWLVCFSLFFVLIHFSGKEKQLPPLFQISDAIPSGFVMVPVELKNHSAVDHLITSFGVVDLYQSLKGMNFPHKLAQSVRIIRLETGQFSVLIPEHDVASFVQYQSEFYAVIQNSEKKDVRIILPQLKQKRSIVVKDY